MKKLGFVIVGILFLSGIAGTANADTVTLTDTTTFTLSGTTDPEDLIGYGYRYANFLEGPLDFLTWTHNFTFDPPFASISSATLTIAFLDDEGDVPIFMNLNGTSEYVGGAAEGWTWDFGEVDSQAYQYSVNVSSVGDGKFTVGLLSLGGDVQVVDSVLNITYQTVPDSGSTLLLLGLGIGAANLIWYRWRK